MIPLKGWFIQQPEWSFVRGRRAWNVRPCTIWVLAGLAIYKRHFPSVHPEIEQPAAMYFGRRKQNWGREGEKREKPLERLDFISGSCCTTKRPWVSFRYTGPFYFPIFKIRFLSWGILHPLNTTQASHRFTFSHQGDVLAGWAFNMLAWKRRPWECRGVTL